MRLIKALVVCAVLGAAQAAEWPQQLYLGRGDYWRQRIPVVVTNAGTAAVEGAAVELQISALAGASADALRVCDATGTELLWHLRDAAGEAIRKGTIPAGSTLTIPVDCAAQQSAQLYVYFDNPSAWPVPDFLPGTTGLRNGGMETGEGDA
ncbi:MAG: hypothetical protein NTY53_23745, partial [Kiritimatiellaeota bacterium]|nr:hypothetical protein [Kiritimatiellota bacterium]